MESEKRLPEDVSPYLRSYKVLLKRSGDKEVEGVLNASE